MPFAVPWAILHLVSQEIGGVSFLNKKGKREVKTWEFIIHIDTKCLHNTHDTKQQQKKHNPKQLLTICCDFQKINGILKD